MGKLYRSRHELCFVFKKNSHYTDNIELAKHGQYRTNCSEYADVNSFGVHKSDLKFHNTMKLYKMFKDIILDASPRGGIVFDGFIGSDPIIIATEKAKRICYGIDVIHAGNGKTYNELLYGKLCNFIFHYHLQKCRPIRAVFL